MEQALEEDRRETLAWLRELEQQKSKEGNVKKKQRPFSTSPSSLQPSSAFVASGEKDQSLTHPPGHAKQSVQESNQGDSSTTRRFSEPSLKVQELPATERRASIDPSEALKRGRSFGPLLKAGTHQGSLKRSGKTSSLKTDVVGDGGEVTDSGKQDSVIDDPDTVGLTDETEESSDDYDDNDGDGARGRKRTLDGYDMSPESPTVTVTPPIGDKTTAKRFIVKPKTSFDHSVSRERPISPTQADIENLQEIRKAQNLGVAISTTDTPDSHKVIRTIIRGDYCYFQDQAKEENIRVRAYLLAINLRPEAAYATEWAIGTVLRDGDTLLAIFAVDKDAETGLPEDGLPVGEGGKAMQETTAEVDKMTAASQKSSRLLGMKNFLPRSRRSSVAAETRVSKSSKKQQERMHALEKLSDLCVDLLRKTKLQVRVVIEVIHCKVARSMLIEAIDVLQPTLVIVGSRGRRALAGSFSRYLIMKSSVPVMTARMKLSSRKVKSPSPKIRLDNNLVPSKRFADVKIDELEARLNQQDDESDSQEGMTGKLMRSAS